MKSSPQSPIIQLGILAGAVVGVFYAAEASLPALQGLPISSLRATAAPPASAAIDPGALANLSPLVAKAPPKASPAPTADDVIPVDDAFFLPRHEEKKSAAEAPTDYFPLLAKALSVQAITDEGAILNQQFHAYGSALQQWEYPGPGGKMVAPILRRTTKPNTVRVTEPGTGRRHLDLSLKDE